MMSSAQQPDKFSMPSPRLDNPLDPVHRQMTWELAKKLGRTMVTWDTGRFYNILVVLRHQTSV